MNSHMRLLKITSIFVILTFLFMMGLVPNRDVTPGKTLNPLDPNTRSGGTVPKTAGRIYEKKISLKERATEKSRSLRSGMTAAKGKLSTDLLQLIDDRFLFSSMSIEKLKEDMIKKKQMVRSGSKVRGVKAISSDAVYVYIQLGRGQDPTIVNPYVANVANTDRNNGLVVAWVEPSKLESLASMSAVKSIRTVEPPRHKMGLAYSEGDYQLYASELRNRLGYAGAGVKIGVISDGVDTWTWARDRGELPVNLHVLRSAYTLGGDEGTAMLEIIHDLAPAAELYFHDCGNDILEFNAAIDALVAAGCNVIVDDIGWPCEPFFADGVVAQHVSNVISTNQIIYVSAAGNDAQIHYQGDFYQDIAYPGYHDFSQGQSGTPDLYALVPDGGTIKGVLQWNDPLLGSSNDYCVRLFDVTNNYSYIGETITVQDGDDDPIDSFRWTNETGEEIVVAISVYKNIGVDKTLEIYLDPENGASVSSINTTSADSIFGHPAVEGVIAVGAINSTDINQDEIANYSSWGPVTLLSGQRAKPDICGIDAVTVSGAGGFPNPFYGTSAAAPHIAAIAGLLKGLCPAKSASEIKSMLTGSAVDLGSAGFDYVYGYGRADALHAFNGNDITPPTVSVNAITMTNGLADSVAVTSSELGRVYIVEQNQPQATVVDLEFAVEQNNFGNYSYMQHPGTPVNVSTSGLIPGIYKAYAVDGANNMSAVSANSITISPLANKNTSIVDFDKYSARINDDSMTVTVDLNDTANNAAGYNWLYVAHEGIFNFTNASSTWIVNADHRLMQTDIGGHATFQVSSATVGTFRIAFGLTDKIDDYLNVTASAIEAGLITQKNITFTAPPSNNAYLNGITLSEGTLEPGFSQDCLNYEVYANNNISSIDITSATSHAGATLTIDAVPVASGDLVTVNLAVGENTIDIMVTAEDGVATKTYQVVIYRSGGEVSAANSSAEINAPLTKGATRNITVTVKDVGNNLIFLTEKTLNIVVTVINNILDTTEVYTVHDDAAVNSDRTVLKTAITDVYGKMTFPMIIPAQVDLNDGINIAVKTGANELIGEFSYINTPSSNADLSSLTISSGSLSPIFQSGTLAYAVSVANSVSSLTVTPTKADANASYVIKKNGASEGVTDNTVSLDVGNNVISIIVTAQDGITTKEYTITVTRAQADTGGGGSSGGGGAPPAQPPVQTQPSKLEKVYPGIGNPVTADDKKINESLQTTGSAKVDVTGSSDNSANISGSVVSQLMSLNKPIIVANEGVQVNIATSNLSVSGENSTVRIGVNPLTEEGRDRILESSEWGQSTGIFVIGGQIFDLSAQIDTTENGTIDTQKIENFTEPVGVTLDLSGLNLTEGMINELCGVRLEKDAQGNTVFVRLGGFYNPANKTFTFYTERFSLYSIMWTPKIKTMSFFVGADVVRINQNYKKIDVPPRIIGNRTMVPLRFIGEALGAQLDWDEKTRTVTYTLGNRGLKMTVDVKLPGQDMPPIIINGRTMVPLRYVSEYLGAKVTWFPSNKMVTVVK